MHTNRVLWFSTCQPSCQPPCQPHCKSPLSAKHVQPLSQSYHRIVNTPLQQTTVNQSVKQQTTVNESVKQTDEQTVKEQNTTHRLLQRPNCQSSCLAEQLPALPTCTASCTCGKDWPTYCPFSARAFLRYKSIQLDQHSSALRSSLNQQLPLHEIFGW